MSRYCLDTSAYSQFRRGHPRAVSLIASAEYIAVPAVVAGELWAGFLLGTRFQRNADELQEFLEHPAVELLEISLAVARLYGEIYLALRRAGTPVPTNDMWVAATAVHSRTTVLTFDSDLELLGTGAAIVLQP